MYEFNKELSIWINDKSIERKELIALLQTDDYETFKGLDTITLSRWLKGRSTPSLDKQLKIAHSLERDLCDIIRRMPDSKTSERLSKVTLTALKSLDASINTLTYQRLDKINSQITTLEYSEYQSVLGDFYRNLSALKPLRDELVSLGHDISYKVIMLKNDRDEILGHWSSIVDIDKLKEVDPFSLVSKKELSQSVLVKLSYFLNSEHLFELVINACCYYLVKVVKNDKRYAYVQVVSYAILEFVKRVFYAEEVKYYPPRIRGENGVYLLRVDIVRAVVSPVLLPLIKSRLHCMSTCRPELCGKCQLAEV